MNLDWVYWFIVRLLKLQNTMESKTIICRNPSKYIHNYNKLARQPDYPPVQSNLALQSVLGINQQQISGTRIFALNGEETLYYSSNYFTAHNLITKETISLPISHPPYPVIYIQKFLTSNKTDLILTIHRGPTYLYLGQLEISGNLTEANVSVSENDSSQNYSWKVSRLSSKPNFDILSMTFHKQKSFIYLLTCQTLPTTSKVQKCLWVYDLKRECLLMSPQIRPNSSKSQVEAVWATDQATQIYIMGSNYFRFWNISFNQKHIKESNYRNIQRSIAGSNILRLYDIQSNNYRRLIVLTQHQILVLKKNQLETCLPLPTDTLQQGKNKENIQMELQSSLNQIYKMKFMFDDEDNDLRKETTASMRRIESQNDAKGNFYAATQLWTGEGCECFMVASREGGLLTYSLVNGQLKLINEYTPQKKHSFELMTTSRKGQILLLCERDYQRVFVIDKYSLSSEQSQQMKELWGGGQISHHDIVAVSSPDVHQRVVTLDTNSVLRMWDFKSRQRKILFEERLPHKATCLAMHPCGMLVALNCSTQIKLMGILPNGLYQVMSAKTNYTSTAIRFTECGNYLISNQQNLLIFYNPFSLKTIGYYESPQLKSTILDFVISPQGTDLVLQTSDLKCFIQPLKLSNYTQFQYPTPSHIQTHAYTAFIFEEVKPKTIATSSHMVGGTGQPSGPKNLFVGCTKHKYMVLYSNFGKDLIAQFPIQDCYITHLVVAHGWLFATTSKSTVRVYRWPILEQECSLEITDPVKGTVKYRLPPHAEYCLWADEQPITMMHKLSFTNKLVILRGGGVMNLLNYDRAPSQRLQQGSERKKMMQVVNQTFYILKNDSEKRNRMIDKTEGDIVKVQNQIAKQKNVMERKYREECLQIESNFQAKCQLQQQEKKQYLSKLEGEMRQLKKQIEMKKKEYDVKKANKMEQYCRKTNYQSTHNNSIEQDTKNIVVTHKANIKKMIEDHKENIRLIKNGYREKIIEMRQEFEEMVGHDYPQLVTKKTINKSSNSQKEKRQERCSIQLKTLPEHQSNSDGDTTLTPHELIILNLKVEELKSANSGLEKQLSQIKGRVGMAQEKDENMQRQFQRCLQEYNSGRFANLSLHSEVLKMRNQLVERKQVMENKQEVVNIAYHQREKLQNYKQLVRGTLQQMQTHKERGHRMFVQKQNELQHIFDELCQSHKRLQQLNQQQKRLQSLMAVHEKDRIEGLKHYESGMTRLKQLQKYLLLEGMTQDNQKKKKYLERENMLNQIHFFKKRMSMEFMREKKSKVLKKSAMNMALKQNKNLIEECNQLRGEAIEYEHAIRDLGKKIGEANRMVLIETKLKEQKDEVKGQRSQLEAIREMFNREVCAYDDSPFLEE